MATKVISLIISLAFFLLSAMLLDLFGEYAFSSFPLAATVTIPLVPGLFFLFATRLPDTVRSNVVLGALSAGAALYLFELSLQMGWYVPPDDITLGKPGREFDDRDVATVVRDLRHDGEDAYPSVFPRGLFVYRGSRGESALDGVLPLGGISEVTTVVCNETGEYLIYRSDERGFNNPPGLWSGQQVDILALGDSFTQGHCVGEEQGFVARIRARYPRTVNLGMASNGPLTALAGLGEYAPVLRPKVVLWFYYEENDLSEDLPIESRIDLLGHYLEPGFSQGLDRRRGEIDRKIKEWLQGLEEGAPGMINLPPRSGLEGRFNLFDFIFLRAFRNNQHILLGPKREYVNLFAEVLGRAREISAEVGAWLYLVNIPGKRRFTTVLGRLSQNLRRERVFAMLEGMEIPIIDMVPAFESRPRPASLFYSHYNVEGHALVATEVLRVLTEDGTLSGGAAPPRTE